MRILAAALILTTATACQVEKTQLRSPYAAARYQSTKSALEFGQCAAKAMGAELHQKKQNIWVIRTNDLGVHVARWDFISSMNGSEAELRAGVDGDVGADLVKNCA